MTSAARRDAEADVTLVAGLHVGARTQRGVADCCKVVEQVQREVVGLARCRGCGRHRGPSAACEVVPAAGRSDPREIVLEINLAGLVGDDLHLHRVRDVFGRGESPLVVGDVGGERLPGEEGFAENPLVGGHGPERKTARSGDEASQRDAHRTRLVQRQAVAVADDGQTVGLFGEGHVAEVVGRAFAGHPARQRGTFGGSDLDGRDRGLLERFEAQLQHRGEVPEAQRHGLLL